MACGTPVIAYDLPCYKDFCTPNNSLILKKSGPEHIASGIGSLLKDHKRWKHISESGLATARRLDWDKITERVEKIYQNVLQR